MKPRVVERLGVADAVSAGNAALGFLAVVVASVDVLLSARLLLLAAVLDGLDGVLARRFGGTAAGDHLDSLADVASFAVAPAALTVAVATGRWSLAAGDTLAYVVAGTGGAYVAMAVVRLALYNAYDTGEHVTEGIPTTLAATLLGAAVLAGAATPAILVATLALFTAWMVAPVTYPDLLARDALIMGVVHALAVLFPVLPDPFGRTFPWALLFLAVSYLLLSPWFYWREV